jgi:hypothetical protein
MKATIAITLSLAAFAGMMAARPAAGDTAVVPYGAASPADDMPAMPDVAPSLPQLPIAPAAQAAGAIVLDGDMQTAEVDCARRDVLIHGDGGTYRLLNGCRSVSVQGRANRIDAELAPGARVSIGGADVDLSYVVSAPGAPPTLSVTGTNSRAVAVPRLDEAWPPARP